MVTKRTEIPDRSILKNEERSFDYIDSFRSSFTDKDREIPITTVLKLFASGGPKWANSLMIIRDKIVKPFGLQTSDSIVGEQKDFDDITYEPGERIGIFKLLDKAENELVLGEDDKHLSFVVSLLLDSLEEDPDKRMLSVTTAVKFNNLLGKLYFLPVKFFHQLIVRKTVEGIIRGIENKKN